RDAVRSAQSRSWNPPGTTVPTIPNRAVLVSYAWPENSPRYNRIAKFVNAFFGKIDQFTSDRARHPKWRDVSLTADMPGWTRFKPAADWLAGHPAIAHARRRRGTVGGPPPRSPPPAP